MYLPFSLSNPVSRQRWNYHNKPMDPLKVQMGLERLGFMEPRADDIYVSTDSDRLFGAMEDFQKANGLEADGIANPDGPTHQAMNKALTASSAGKPAKPLIARPIPAADAAMRHKNERDIRVLGRRTDPGDFPVLMARTLLSKNGEAAAPEVADLLGQIYARNPDMGRKARAELAGVVDVTSMGRLDDAAGIPSEDRVPPQRPKEPEPPTLELTEAQNKTSTLPSPTDDPIDADELEEALSYGEFGLGDVGNAVLRGPVITSKVNELRSKVSEETTRRFPNGTGHNDEADAYRHALWSFKMARDISPHAAKQIGDGHERKPLGSYSYEGLESAPRGEKLMDLYNNRIGRDLERKFRDDPRPAEDIVMEALRAGRLQTRPFSLSR